MTLYFNKRGPMPHRSTLPVCLMAILLLAGCGQKPAPTTSVTTERAIGARDASQKMSDGMRVLMDSIQNPPGAFHFSYKAQKNLNPKFPEGENAEPEVGPIEIEADVTPEDVNISQIRGAKKTETKAKKSDEIGWPMAQLALTGSLLDPGLAMAFGGATARTAGSESVGGVLTEKYEFDTATASGAAKAGMEMAMSMMGGKVKFKSVKGVAWVDKATGRMVKFTLDTELIDKAGNPWKEHDELLVTPN